MSIYCPYCGKELPDNSAFCFQCGKKIPNFEGSEQTEIVDVPEIKAHAENKSVIEDNSNESQKTVVTNITENTKLGTDEFDLTKKGKSIASFVLGVLGVLLCGSWFSFVLGIIGFFIGVSAYKHRQGIKGLIIAGMILSTIAVILRIIVVIIEMMIQLQ